MDHQHLSSLAKAVFFALTGEAAPSEATASSQITDLLAESGWDIDEIERLRSARWNAGLTWPFIVPSELRPEIGPAQLNAAVVNACAELGIRRKTMLVRNRKMPLTTADARLIAERPPHHDSDD